MPEANSEKDLEMHAYLRAIGFKEIISKKKLRELLQMVIEEPDEQRLISLESLEGNVAELRRSFADGMGIIVHGYYDESGSFRDEYYIPYLEGRTAPVETDITITRHVSRESFAGVCEDFRLGATLGVSGSGDEAAGSRLSRGTVSFRSVYLRDSVAADQQK